MTSTKSLSERLREFSVVVYNSDGSQGACHPFICTQAADALDAQQVEIERLRADAKDERKDWQLQVAAWKDKADRRADEIERLRADLDRATRNRGERLRELADHLWDVEYRIQVDEDAKTILDAADDLDQKDAEIAQLKIDCEAWRQTAKTFEVAGRPDAAALDQQAAEIELLKEGRRLHDEHADHLEHELAAQSALIAQATAVLANLILRFERCARSMGNDQDMIDEATSDHKKALVALRANGVL